MAQLTIPRTYADGDVLYEADLDQIKDSVEELINITKLNGDNIASQGVTASIKAANSAITTSKLADSSLSSSKILDDNITTIKIVDESVTTYILQDDGTTVAYILDDNVTSSKIYSLDNSSEESILQFDTASTSYVSTGHSISITSTGLRPTIIIIQRGSFGSLIGGALSSYTGISFLQLKLVLDSSTTLAEVVGGLGRYTTDATAQTNILSSSQVLYCGILAAGPHTLDLYALVINAAYTATLSNYELKAIEL